MQTGTAIAETSDTLQALSSSEPFRCVGLQSVDLKDRYVPVKNGRTLTDMARKW